jgi:PAS domain S-box-containing protein
VKSRMPRFLTSRSSSYPWPTIVLRLAILAVIAIPIFAIGELFRAEHANTTHAFHLLIMLLVILLLAMIVLGIEYFSRRKLSLDVAVARDRLRMAMTSGRSMGWDWHIRNERVAWFGDLNTIFGIASDSVSRPEQDFLRYVHPQDRERVAEAVAETRANRKVYTAEFRAVREDGTVRWVIATGKFYYARNGEPERMLGVAVDITDRKQAHEALIKSEEKFSKAFRESPMALTLTSVRDHRYLDVNETFEQVTGWSREEVISRNPFDINIWVDPAQREEYVKRTLAKGGVRNWEVRYRCKNGEQRVGLGSGELIEIDGETCLLSAIIDITDRKQTEEALRQKESELAEAQRLAQLGSWKWNPKNGAITWSEELYRIHGLDPKLPPPSREELQFLFTPESWERLQAEMMSTVQTGLAQTLGLELIRPDGSKRWVTARSEAVRDARGEVIFLRGTTQDISERRHAEARLREYEEAVEGADEMIAVVDREYRYVIANRAFLDHRNMSREQVVGRPVSEILNKKIFEAVVKQKLDECFTGKIVKFEMQYTYSGLGERDIFASYFPIEGPSGVERVACILQDITERKRIEEKLHESEVRLAAVVSSAMDAIIAVDETQRIVLFNAAAEKMFGCSAGEAMGAAVDRFIPQPYRSQHRDHMRRFNETGVTNRLLGTSSTLLGLRSNGQEFPIEASISQVEVDRKKLFTVIIRDDTKRRQAEEALRESEERFRRVVEHIGEALIVDDLAGHVVFANDQFLSLFGFRREQLPNLKLEDYVAPPYRTELRDRHDRRMRGETVPTHFEYEGIRPDGTRMWLEVDIVPVSDQTGKLVGTQSALRDITERKRAEQVIQENEQRFRHLIESSTDWVWEINANVVYTYAGPQCRAILGYEPAEIIGKTPFDFMPADESLRVASIFNPIAAERRPFRALENVNIHKDGHLVVLETNGVPVIDKDGTFRGYRGMDRDITERRRAEESLRESEERFRRVVEHIADALAVDDVTGRVVFANDQFLGLFGFRREELQDITLEDYVAPEYRTEVRERHNRRMRGEPMLSHFEYEGIRRDGTRLWVDAEIVLIKDREGKLIGTQKLLRDITERKRVEHVLRESEERFRLVANTAPVMIWMSGTDKLCNYFNKPWLDFTGRPLEAELGTGWADGVHSEDLDDCLRTYEEAFDRREAFTMPYRLRRHDGKYRWLSDRGVPRFNQDGSFAGYIGSCIDITEQKLAEEALATVGRRLIEAHEEESTWIGRELHDDINQRLALVAVELDRGMQHSSPSPSELHDHIHHARRRIVEIAKDVQGLSHRLHSSKLDYLGLAAAANSFCREFSEQNKAEVKFTHAGIPRTLPKEISLCLFRVLQEALQNAVKHSGVRQFTVEFCGSADEIELTVADAGIGFEEQEATSRRGLGLISMRERLQLVSGKFSIESKPGHGTTIRARVPLKAAEEYRAIAG